MAIRDREVSDANRASIVDLVSIVIAMASLFVSMSALVVSVVVWKRPFPADPTAIPTFGQNGSPETIDAGNGGRKFFAFLEKHPGRKIRIIARVVEDDRIKVRERGRVLEIHECMRPDCYVEQLSIKCPGQRD